MYMGLGFCKVKKMEEKHSKNGVTEIWNTSGNDERWDTCQLPGVHPLVCITKNLLQIQRIAPQTSANWSVGSHHTSEMAGYLPHQWKAISPLINPYHLSECPNSFIFPLFHEWSPFTSYFLFSIHLVSLLFYTGTFLKCHVILGRGGKTLKDIKMFYL